MKFTSQDIENIANLAKIAIDDTQSTQYANDLSNIFDLIIQMDAIDTENIAPMYNPHDLTLRLREDEVTETNNRETYLKLAPASDKGLFLVPKVIE